MSNSTSKIVVRIRKAGDEHLYEGTYLTDPTLVQLLDVVSSMGDVNINYFYQNANGSVWRRSETDTTSVAFERQGA
jgi:hypothetical protein